MLGLCYFVACMTLQQCREYRTSLFPVLPGVPDIDIFYWMNTEDLEPTSHEFSLTKLIEQDAPHWDFVSPEAGNWLPWTKYIQNSQCRGIVRLDNGFVFSDIEVLYSQYFERVAALGVLNGATLLNLESECGQVSQLGVDGANILLDLPTMQGLLDSFFQHTLDNNVHFYTSGAFANFLAPYAITQNYALDEQDLTYCSEVETLSLLTVPVPATKQFVRLARPLNALRSDIQINALFHATSSPRRTVFH